MVCSKCGGKLKVMQTVHDTDNNETHRRKKCKSCGKLIYTREILMDNGRDFNELVMIRDLDRKLGDG